MVEKLTAISGPMFSGKTTELLSIMTKKLGSKEFFHSFKPALDTRSSDFSIATHDGKNLPSMPIENSRELLEKLDPKATVVFIDEVQFFDMDIIDVIKILLERDIQVFVSGLPTDFKGEPFGPMPILMSMADENINLTAICQHRDGDQLCKLPATKTQRIIEGKPANYNDPIVLIGAKDFYEPRCYKHHEVPGKPESKILYESKK